VSEDAARPLSATLIARRDLAPGVVLLQFKMTAGEHLRWQAGQYLTLSTADAPELLTPYSIASAPEREREGEFDLAVSANGGQELLARLHLGARVFVSGPQGRFVWEPVPGALLLVGMGTGLAPLRAILQAALDHAATTAVTLLFGARTEADILWRDEFTELAARDSRFAFEPTLSRPSATWRGRTGRVQDHLREIAARSPDVSAYLCGSRAMVGDSVQRLIEESGVDPTRIRSEAH
jgi:CDP-4-dehydro-6-deoxyglucose reductase